MESPLEKLVQAHKELLIRYSNSKWESDIHTRLEGRTDGKIVITVKDDYILVDEFQADVIINGLLYLLGRDEK